MKHIKLFENFSINENRESWEVKFMEWAKRKNIDAETASTLMEEFWKCKEHPEMEKKDFMAYKSVEEMEVAVDNVMKAIDTNYENRKPRSSFYKRNPGASISSYNRGEYGSDVY